MAKPDIIDLIVEDHKPLIHLIKILKNSSEDLSVRKSAFEKFGLLLVAHANSEEQALYNFMEMQDDLCEMSFEGKVEHGLAEEMLEAVLSERDFYKWSTKVKILAETGESHVKQEESEMLPEFKKHSTFAQRQDIGQKYITIRELFDTTAEKMRSESTVIM